MSDNTKNKVINPSSCHPPPFHTPHCLLCMVLLLYPLINRYHHTHPISLKMLICSFDVVTLVGCIFPWHSAFLLQSAWQGVMLQYRGVLALLEDNSCTLRQELKPPQGGSCNSDHQPHMMERFVVLLFHEGRKWSRCSCQEATAYPCTPARQGYHNWAVLYNLYITKTLMHGVSPLILGLLGKKLPFCLSTFCGCSSTHPW